MAELEIKIGSNQEVLNDIITKLSALESRVLDVSQLTSDYGKQIAGLSQHAKVFDELSASAEKVYSILGETSDASSTLRRMVAEVGGSIKQELSTAYQGFREFNEPVAETEKLLSKLEGFKMPSLKDDGSAEEIIKKYAAHLDEIESRWVAMGGGAEAARVALEGVNRTFAQFSSISDDAVLEALTSAEGYEGLLKRILSLTKELGTAAKDAPALESFARTGNEIATSFDKAKESAESMSAPIEEVANKVQVVTAEMDEYSRRMQEVAGNTSYEGAGQTLPLLVKQLEEAGREILATGGNAEEAREKIWNYLDVFSQISDVSVSGTGANANAFMASVAQSEDIINSYLGTIQNLDMATALDETTLTANLTLARETIAGTGIALRTFVKETQADGSVLETELGNDTKSIADYLANLRSQQEEVAGVGSEARKAAQDAILNSQREKLGAFKAVIDEVEETLKTIGSHGNLDVFSGLIEKVNKAEEELKKELPMMNSIVQKEGDEIMQNLANLEDRLGGMNQFNELQFTKRKESTDTSVGGVNTSFAEYNKLTEQRIAMKVEPSVDTTKVDERIAELRDNITKGVASASMALDTESKSLAASIKREEENFKTASDSAKKYEEELKALNAIAPAERTEQNNNDIQRVTEALATEKKNYEDSQKAILEYKSRLEEVKQMREQVAAASIGSDKGEFENARQAADGMNIYNDSVQKAIALQQQLSQLQGERKNAVEGGARPEEIAGIDAQIEATYTKLQQASQNATVAMQSAMDASKQKLEEYQAKLAELTEKQAGLSAGGDYKAAFTLSLDIDETKSKIAELSGVFDEQKAKLADLQQQMAQISFSAPMENGMLGSIVGDIDGDLKKVEQLREELNNLRDKKNEEGANIPEIDAQIESTKAQLDAIVDGVGTKFNAANVTIASGIEAIQERYQVAQEQMSQANQGIAEAMASGDSEKLATAQQAYDTAREAANSYEATLKQLAQSKEELNQKMADEAYNATSASIDELRGKSEDLLAAFEEQKTKLSTIKDTSSEAYASVKESMESNLAQANAALVAAITKQEQQYKSLKDELVSLEQQKQSLAEGGDVEKLAEINQKIADTTEQVRNAGLALREADESYKQFVESNKEFADTIGTNTSALSDNTREEVNHIGTLSEVIEKNKDFKSLLDKMPQSVQDLTKKFADHIKTTDKGMIDLKGTLKGVANDGLGAVKKGLDALRAHPIIFMVSALITGFMLLKKVSMAYFEGSAEGQKEYAKITAAITEITKAFGDIIIATSKVTAKSFIAMAKAAMNLWDILSDSLFNKKMWSNIGAGFKAILSGDFKNVGKFFSDAFEDAGKSARKFYNDLKHDGVETVNAFGDAWKTVVKNVGGLRKNLRTAIAEADKMNKFSYGNGKEFDEKFDPNNQEQVQAAAMALGKTGYQKYSAEQDAYIQDLRTQIMGETDNAKKLELIRKAKDAINQKYAIAKELAQQESDVIGAQVDRHESNLEALGRKRQAQMAVFQAEKQEATELRFLTRQETTLIKKANKEREQAAKKAAKEGTDAYKREQQERAAAAKRAAQEATRAWEEDKYLMQQQRKAEDNIAKMNKVQIDLMNEGFAKQQALRDYQHKQEMTQLERQAEDARNQAIEHAKKLWDEEQKRKEDEYNNDAANKKSGKKYEVVAFDYQSDDAQAVGQAAYDEIIAQRAGMLALQQKEDRDALTDMLSGYEDYTTQKYLLEKEFNDKVASLRAARALAEKQGNTELANMYSNAIVETTVKYNQDKSNLTQNDVVKNNVNMAASLGDLDKVSGVSKIMMDFAKQQLVALKEFTKSSDFKSASATDQKTIMDAISKLQGATMDDKGIHQAAKAAKEFARELISATTEIANETEKLKNLQTEAAAKKTERDEVTKSITEETTKKVTLETQREELTKKLEATSDPAERQATEERIAAIQKDILVIDKLNARFIALRDTLDQQIQDNAAQQVATQQNIQAQQNAATFAAQGLNSARARFNDGMNGIKSAMDGIRSLGSAKNLSDIYNSIMGIVDSFKKAFDNIGKQIGDGISGAGSAIGKGAKDANKALSDVGKQTAESLGDATNELAKQTTEGVKDATKGTGDALDGAKGAGWVGAAISMADLINEIGVEGLLDNISDMMEGAVSGIIESIVSGGLFKSLANSVVGSIMAPFEAIFGKAGNMEELLDEIDDLNAQNEVLAEAAQDLIEALNNATTANAAQKEDEAKKAIEAQRENYKRIIADNWKMWERGSKSIANYMNKGDGKKAMNKLGISSVKDLANMSAEERNKLKLQNGGKDWADFLSALRDAAASSHNGDAEQLIESLEALDGLDDQLDDIRETTKEIFAGITFDSMFDNWKSTLKDMSSTAEDFAATLEQDLNDAIINSIADAYSEEMRELYDDIAAYGKRAAEINKTAKEEGRDVAQEEIDELTRRREAIEEKQKKITQDSMETKQFMRDNGLVRDTEQNKAGTTKGFEAMSSEQADALNGRFTALQISNQGILNTAGQILEKSTLLNMTMEGIFGYAKSMSIGIDSLLDIQANSYLELQEISRSTTRAANYLQSAMPSIEKLNTIAEKL